MPKPSKKLLLQAFARERDWQNIGRAEWDQLRAQFSESMIRSALPEIGIPLDQPFAGVGTKTLAQLESSLTAMAETYAANPEARGECRQVVIAAKDRARFAARNPKADPAKRDLKEEMVEWMLVWLGDPAMFVTWSALRKRAVH